MPKSMFKEPSGMDNSNPASLRNQPMKETKRYNRGNISVVESEREYLWKNKLDKREGKFLELAGPTRHLENDIADFLKYRENTVCTNVYDGEGVDKVADAENLPFGDKRFKAVFISKFRMPDEQRRRLKPKDAEPDLENAEHITNVAKEAWRVLDEGGILVWLHLETKEELQSIESIGFVPVFSQDAHYEKSGSHRYQTVFVKESQK